MEISSTVAEDIRYPDRAACRILSIETRYSWWTAAVTLLMTSLSFGAVTSVPILLKPMASDWGVGMGEMSLVHMSTMFGAGFGSLLLGRALDRYGFFRIALAGAMSTATGLLLAATATHLITLYLAFGLLIGGVGQGAFFSPITAVLSHWFDRHRALAIAIAASGQSVGGLFVPPLLRWGAEQAGWRPTLAIYGAVSGIILFVCAFVFRRIPPSDIAAGVSSIGQAMAERPTRRGFIYLGMSMAFFNLATFVVMGHLTAFGEEQGFVPLAAATLLSSMLGVTLLSRLSVGYFSGRWGKYRVLTAVSVLHVLGVVLLAVSHGYLMVATSGVLIGLGFGGYLPGYAVLVREMFPARESGRRVAEIYFFAFLAAGIGSWVGGWLRDLSGNYSLTFCAATISALIGMLVLISQRKLLGQV